MNNSKKYWVLGIFMILFFSMQGCGLIGDIFDAGLWVGVVLTLIIIIIIFFIFRAFRSKK
jgi:hypothetical protein